MIYEKIAIFFNRPSNTNRSYSVQSLSKVLNLKEDTASKYLRWMHNDGTLSRVRAKNNGTSCYRYKKR